MHEQRSHLWQQLIAQVAGEYQQLPQAEIDWIASRLARIEQLQERLQRLFEFGSGLQACRDCLGECCAKGHNHMTLANLLQFLQREQLPPAADFARTCPFLGAQGCLLKISERPYNCISFVCDIIENSLTLDEVAEFYRLEQQLRVCYLEFAERYTGGGLTGLLLQAQRLNGQPFLARKPQPDNGKGADRQEM